jgi:hypothetical protein
MLHIIGIGKAYKRLNIILIYNYNNDACSFS